MTISTQTSLVTYVGNGATVNFPFSFVGVSATDIQVILTSASGVESILNPSVYTLAIYPASVGQLWGVGGYVIYPITGSPIQVGEYLTIQRIVPDTQTVSISSQGAFYPQAVEQGLDLLELQLQQISTVVGYTLQCPLVDLTTPNPLPTAANRANGYLAFDSAGQPTILFETEEETVIPAVSPRVVNTSGTASINVLVTDSFGGVSIYQSSSPVTTVQLPTGGGPYPVFDSGLNSETYPITVLPPGGLTILGASSYVLQHNGQSAVFYNDGLQILIA